MAEGREILRKHEINQMDRERGGVSLECVPHLSHSLKLRRF